MGKDLAQRVLSVTDNGDGCAVKSFCNDDPGRNDSGCALGAVGVLSCR